MASLAMLAFSLLISKLAGGRRLQKAVKQKDFEIEETPSSLQSALPRAHALTRTQILISTISDFILRLKKERLVHFYNERLRHLALSLDRQLV